MAGVGGDKARSLDCHFEQIDQRPRQASARRASCSRRSCAGSCGAKERLEGRGCRRTSLSSGRGEEWSPRPSPSNTSVGGGFPYAVGGSPLLLPRPDATKAARRAKVSRGASRIAGGFVSEKTPSERPLRQSYRPSSEIRYTVEGGGAGHGAGLRLPLRRRFTPGQGVSGPGGNGIPFAGSLTTWHTREQRFCSRCASSPGCGQRERGVCDGPRAWPFRCVRLAVWLVRVGRGGPTLRVAARVG